MEVYISNNLIEILNLTLVLNINGLKIRIKKISKRRHLKKLRFKFT